MVGGKVIVFKIGHRFSIDFDLFKPNRIRTKEILLNFTELKVGYDVTLNLPNHLNLMCRNC